MIVAILAVLALVIGLATAFVAQAESQYWFGGVQMISARLSNLELAEGESALPMTSLSASIEGPPPGQLVARWTWRTPGGEWRPLDFKGQVLTGSRASDDGSFVRLSNVQEQAGSIIVDPSFWPSGEPNCSIEASMAVREVDGLLALQPLVTAGENDGPATSSGGNSFGPVILPIPFPETLWLPPLDQVNLSVTGEWTVSQGPDDLDAQLDIALFDRAGPEAVVLETRIRLTVE